MLSQTSEYALRAMTHLAGLDAGVAANSEAIAARTKVPQGYLSKVLRDLVVAELVTSQRGPHGGFTLLRPPEEISLLDVVNAVDPIQRIKRCPLGNPQHLKLCPLHRRIDQAIDMIERQFRETTLADLIADARRVPGECGALAPKPIEATLRGGPLKAAGKAAGKTKRT